MANKREYVRKVMNAVVDGEKVKANVKFEFNKRTGQLYINGAPMNVKTDDGAKAHWIGAAVFIAQMFEDFNAQCIK